MRRKKHKATRRVVKHYKLHYGFREPYKARCPTSAPCGAP